MTGLPLNIDIQQILLHWLNFVILAGGLYILLYKPVKDFMDKRTEYYKELELSAKNKEDELSKQEALYRSKLDGAEAEIKELKSKAMAEAAEASDKKIKEAMDEADKIRKAARANAEHESEQIIKDANEEVAKLAAMAAKKLLDDEQDIYASFEKAAADKE